MEIPSSVKTIVVLNFICYQAGVDIWGPDPVVHQCKIGIHRMQQSNRPSMDDGIVEVVGLCGPFHEALVRTYLTSGVRMGRGKVINLKYTDSIELPIGVTTNLTSFVTDDSLMANHSCTHQLLSPSNPLGKWTSSRNHPVHKDDNHCTAILNIDDEPEIQNFLTCRFCDQSLPFSNIACEWNACSWCSHSIPLFLPPHFLQSFPGVSSEATARLHQNRKNHSTLF